jgi:peptidoglycan/xylan/chitin deacetylase (PgdA/CDA1 family)
VRPRILLAMLVAAAVLAAPGPAAADEPQRAVPCSRGLVALTFDDGPLDPSGPRLVRLLARLEVPATFFMVGNRVAAHPELVRLVDRAGFAIGNHTREHATSPPGPAPRSGGR